MNLRYLDTEIHNYIFRRRKPKLRRRLRSIIEKYSEVKVLRSRRCPWCGRVFKRKGNLVKHLSFNCSYYGKKEDYRCPLMYSQLLKDIASEYIKSR
jgi:Zinc finger, C2H2 type.